MSEAIERNQAAATGLALLRSFVNAHGGAVGTENNPQGGVRLRVTLPMAPEKER